MWQSDLFLGFKLVQRLEDSLTQGSFSKGDHGGRRERAVGSRALLVSSMEM